MPKRKSLKHINEIRHAMQRFEERYGIVFTRAKRRETIEKIQTGQSKLLKIVSNMRTIHSVEVDGKNVSVVYDKYRHEIVTVLPEGDEHGKA